MKRIKRAITSLAIGSATLLLLASCHEDKPLSNDINVEKWRIASEMVDCVGVAPQKCLLYKSDQHDEWQMLYQPIENFRYEPGYEYLIHVAKETMDNPPADGSSIRYSLVKELLKQEKESYHLPTSSNQ